MILALVRRESDFLSPQHGNRIMENGIVWLALGGVVIAIVVAATVVQKKSGALKRLSEELTQVRRERDELSEERDLVSEEVVQIRRERDEKSLALEKLEKTFEEQIDEVVESSIQKIAHAEQAKEEAVRAAKDNYEVAAEAYAQL